MFGAGGFLNGRNLKIEPGTSEWGLGIREAKVFLRRVLRTFQLVSASAGKWFVSG